MSNLFDQNPTNTQEFNPAADNRTIKVQAGFFGKFIFILLLIFSFGIPYVIKKNKFLAMQNKINNSASGIDVQLTKRFDTLTKLADAVSAYKKQEEDMVNQFAQMRSLIYSNPTANASQIESLNSSIFGRLIAVSENYPDLKSSNLFRELMDQSAYLEREIAAARRVYNMDVNEFNSSIFTWPNSVVASFEGLSTKPLYQASAAKREDVKFNF
ncbi:MULTISPECIES: LemA family protein [unclassified Mycoplasma]|uniref:LemA family protein n=1 Tax=unclassified Mycoplasma TaxID=2683645 RepID=UPI00211B8679|nr:MULTISPECIES: LemA family protein [unclassified Mycoplasma]UUM20118.1 LemA family protein [Mycoplasma sp. 1578d]UUM25098.1 LemA family protein [Mycoplasma sp. 3686d]